MRASFLVSALVATATVTACSVTDAQPSLEDGATASADAVVEAASPGGSSADPSGDADQSDPTAAATGFCPPAEKGVAAQRDLLDATDRKSAITGAPDDSGDVAEMNAQGELMLAAVAEVEDRWTTAQSALDAGEWDAPHGSVTTADVDAAFDRYFAAIDVWIVPEAAIAAQSGSISEYDLATFSLVGDPAVQEAAVSGAEALGQILAYTQERCGTLTAFE